MNMFMSDKLTEIASWVIASELVRRAPRQLRLIQTHPGGGQYDCITVMDNGSSLCDFNRQGRLHFNGFASDNEPMDIWRRMVCEETPKNLLDEICQRLRIEVPQKLPAGTGASITYRVIAHVLRLSVFGVEKWSCINGFLDTSGSTCRVQPYFEQFPAAAERLLVNMPGDILGQPAYRFWFLFRGEIPVSCFEITGEGWLWDGRRFNLPQVHRQNRSLAMTAALALGPGLP